MPLERSGSSSFPEVAFKATISAFGAWRRFSVAPFGAVAIAVHLQNVDVMGETAAVSRSEPRTSVHS